VNGDHLAVFCDPRDPFPIFGDADPFGLLSRGIGGLFCGLYGDARLLELLIYLRSNLVREVVDGRVGSRCLRLLKRVQHDDPRG